LSRVASPAVFIIYLPYICALMQEEAEETDAASAQATVGAKEGDAGDDDVPSMEVSETDSEAAVKQLIQVENCSYFSF
jgi:hypothetical protein